MDHSGEEIPVANASRISGMTRSPIRHESISLFLVALSAGSGAAALLYEIVWFQLLELVIGTSAISLGLLLATFMAGTCLGSFILPRVVSVRRNPLAVYAAMELAIGVLGTGVLLALPLVGEVYTAWTGDGVRGLLLRGAIAAAVLLPPTFLMGGALPILARRVSPTTTSAESLMGWLYGANIAGGVFGCLLAGFYLLRVYDLAIATYAAVAVNVVVAGMALALARVRTADERAETGGVVGPVSLREQGEPGAIDRPRSLVAAPGGSDRGVSAIYLAIALSGFCALAAETLWVRTLGLLFGASVYTFSLVVAVYLAGLGIGSAIGALLCRNIRRPRAALGWCQVMAAGAIAWTAYMLNGSFPYWPVNPEISDIWFNFQLDINRAVWALLPPTLLWGATFPFALAAASQEGRSRRHEDGNDVLGVASRNSDGARLVGGLYGANTIGAVLGALSASFLLVPFAGSQRAQQLLIAASAVVGIAVLLSDLVSPTATRRGALWGPAVAVVLGGLSISSVPPLSGWLVAHGRYAATWVGKAEILYAAEGLSSSVAVSGFPSGVRTFHVAGKIQASDVPRDLRLQRMLGHLTTLTAVAPRSVLVIGCGAGVTAGAVAIDPLVERVTLVEIEPLVPKAAAEYFGEANFEVIRDPKVQVRVDDGRHYLMTSKERFDAITADPLDPWVKGAANLYTREFLESARQHLNPGGTITLYVQLFETSLDAVKSLVATFFEVFPDGTAWGNTYEGKGYDMVLLGQVESRPIDLDELNSRLKRPEYARVAASLSQIGMASAVDLFATYAGRSKDLTGWLRDAAINTDRNLRMQYLAGLSLNLDESAAIYSDMLSHRVFPEGLFTGDENLAALRSAMDSEGQ